MENFKPTKYYVEKGLTTLSERHLRRKCVQANKMNVVYVKLSKNKNGSDIWLIEVSSFHLIENRKRKPKPKQTKIKVNYFNVEVSVNFNDSSDERYYLEIVKLIISYTACDLVYKIEKQFDNCYSNHLHMGIHGNLKEVKKYMRVIIKDHLQRKCDRFYDKYSGENKSSLHIKKIVDQDSFIGYVSKGYDRLGDDFPMYMFA